MTRRLSCRRRPKWPLPFAFLLGLTVASTLSAQPTQKDEETLTRLLADKVILSLDVERRTAVMRFSEWMNLYYRDKRWLAEFLAGYVARSLGRDVRFIRLCDEKGKTFCKWSKALSFKTFYF